MRDKFKFLLVILSVVVLAGCAAKPVTKGDSLTFKRSINFPPLGKKMHVISGGNVAMIADYSSKFNFFIKQPVNIGFMLGRVNVSTDEPIFSSTLSDEPVFCTKSRVYRDPLVGPHRIACFVEGSKGSFTQIKVAPGEVWFSKNLNPAVEYSGVEVPIVRPGQILKRELVYEGHQNNSIYFSEKIYEQSLDEPSRIKPVVVKYDAIPAQVSVTNMQLNVEAITSGSITYSVVSYGPQ